MTIPSSMPLLVGEIFVDVTVTPRGIENKLRMGGIAHAARALWALGVPFAAAVVTPTYLEGSARNYLAAFGCQKFLLLGKVSGAPNVTLIFDPTEVDDQEYDTLLRDEKSVELANVSLEEFSGLTDALIFPGTYDLASVSQVLPTGMRLHIDVAYDTVSIDAVGKLNGNIGTVFISTSSKLFLQAARSGMDALVSSFRPLQPDTIVLKENRGGCRLYSYSTGITDAVPAQLGTTVNSVGVGDVFDATYLAFLSNGPLDAALHATFASSAYAQTTEPDVFKNYVRRDLLLSSPELMALGGTFLPWEKRQSLQIYLAAPDFRGGDNSAIERAVSAFEYHNFKIRRPVKENGELPPNSDFLTLYNTYNKDLELLRSCNLVLAVPSARDPGTLVEIGLAIAMGIPVVVYDPSRECANTMVIAGSQCYSQSLDECLNATFSLLSKGRPEAA